MSIKRDKIAWAICPSIREYSCPSISPACHLCPDKVKTSEGPGIQVCRHAANQAADRVLAMLTGE